MAKCPTCGKEFDTDRSVKAHHQAHDLPYYEAYIENELGESVEDFLNREYKENKKSLEEVGEMIGGSITAVTGMMERHGIDSRNRSEASVVEWDGMDEEERKKRLDPAHERTRELVDEGNHNLEEYWDGLTADERKELTSPAHEANRVIYAGYRTSHRGYESWRDGSGGSETVVKVHRLMASLLVDELSDLDGMHVHHENSITWDNRFDNLTVKPVHDHHKDHYSERKIDPETGQFV